MAYLMIVDDDEDFASAAALALGRAGYEVRVELETAPALKQMLARRPDLLILDVMFPEDASAGFELARTIRHEYESLKTLPILMLTAVNVKFPLGFGPGTIDEDWLPVDDFIEKPVDLGALTTRVAAVLAARPA